jgi:hypothetical protein
VSRLENVNYSAWKTETLRKIARALNVRLKITFETFGSLVDEVETFSRKNLERPAFKDDPRFHEREAASTQAQSTIETVNNNLIVSALSLTYTFDSQPPLWDRVPEPFKETRLFNYK